MLSKKVSIACAASRGVPERVAGPDSRYPFSTAKWRISIDFGFSKPVGIPYNCGSDLSLLKSTGLGRGRNPVRCMTKPCFFLLLSGALSLSGVAVSADEGAAFYKEKVFPILEEHCFSCHGAEEKLKGNFRITSREGLLYGGDYGAGIDEENPEKSLLLEMVSYADDDYQMPPKEKLPDADIAILTEWVKRGAPYDPELEIKGAASERRGFTITEEQRNWWAYRPVEKPAIPSVKEGYADFIDADKPNPIDAFLLHDLADAGLTPNEPTNAKALLRRVFYDLTGLPPTPEEASAFAASYEADPDKALSGVVEDLLARPQYGEKWARHWLDLVRYADSSGGGRAMPLPDAWRFRDYVIDSFREDKPLDELITAHIAGDHLPWDDLGERSKNLTATGFLVLGPHNYENQNKEELDLEIVDEQLDTISRAFLGLSFGCARCHDHKFDPVPTHDYYAMAGIFLSTQFVTHANVSKWHTEPIPPTEKARTALAAYEKATTQNNAEVERLKKELAELGVGTGGRKGSVSPSSLKGIVIDDTSAVLEGEWQTSTSNPRWVGAHYIHDRNEQGGEKSARFETRIDTAGTYELRISWSSGDNRSTRVPVEVVTKAKSETHSVNQRVLPSIDDLMERLGRYELEKGETVSVTIRNKAGERGVVIADSVQWVRKDSAAPKVDDPELEKKIETLRKQLTKAEAEQKRLRKEAPDAPRAMSVVDASEDKIGPTAIRIRGVEANHGEIAPRGVLEVASFRPVDIPENASGRLEYAQWIADDRNPLTARVLANRIWLKLMGAGLVRSVDNFGVTGEAPTHPELLDFLANRLVAKGWSTKALVREIMMSDVYSRATRAEQGSMAEADPENKLYWRAHLRPLSAEALRDSMLSLSGDLDEAGGGPSLPPGFKSEFGYEFTTKRRSVYVPVFRNSGHELLSVFDFANPNFAVGKRSRSTLPTQALYLTNNPVVHKRATKAAEKIVEKAETDKERLNLMFRKTLGRAPSASETALADTFLEGSGHDWPALQRALFASVDFRFLR